MGKVLATWTTLERQLENVCGPENYNAEPSGKGLGKLEDVKKNFWKRSVDLRATTWTASERQLKNICGTENYNTELTGKGLGKLEDVNKTVGKGLWI